MARWKITIIFFFAVGISFALLYRNNIETRFRLAELDKLRLATTTSSDGYLIDTSIEESRHHRDRLVKLGRFFHKSFPVFRQMDEQSDLVITRKLVSYLESRFSGAFWELSQDGSLDVWDDVSNESAWEFEIKNRDWER